MYWHEEAFYKHQERKKSSTALGCSDHCTLLEGGEKGNSLRGDFLLLTAMVLSEFLHAR